MALLANVKQNPDDLTPWLVLCDWLEEQDDEADRARGEYCRLCFDKLGTKTYASDWERGERRRHLYRTYHEAWLGPLHPCDPQIEKGLWTIQSGAILSYYLEELEADPETWAWVGKLQLRWGFEEMMDSEHDFGPLFSVLQSLDVADCDISRFAAWPALRGVTVLRLNLPHLWVEQVECLAGSAHLKRLRRLVIDFYPDYDGCSGSDWHARMDAIECLKRAFGNRVVMVGR
jgi:uncharacterized protein (TIGR02996 family)